MALITTTNPADITYRLLPALQKKLLKTLMYKLVMEQFSTKLTAESRGTLSIRFFRRAKTSRTAVNLTQGGQAANLTQVGVGYVDCYLNQRGDDFALTDIVKATDFIDNLEIQVTNMGESAALDYDSIITAAIMGDATTAGKALALGLGAAQTTLFQSNAKYGLGYFERFAGLPNTGNSANDFATLAGANAAQSKFTRDEGLRMATQLRVNDILPKDGSAFAAVVPSSVMFDMRKDVDIKSAWEHRDTEKLYNWEKFLLDGVAYMETTNPWEEAAGGYGTYTKNGKVKTVLFFGDDAVGTCTISDKTAGVAPTAPKLTILDKPDKSDIHNQKIVGGYKSYFGCVLKLTSDPTDIPHVAALRVQSTFA